ncbi:MAG TPA: hypothetical protein VLT47_04665 [Anaeromyxobacteraceae bacterium]|nr:hypothetical protein [Anaeromyxobacteraceae bacterium]
MSVDVLERVQTLLRESREHGEELPRERSRKVFVDPSGRIRLGDDVPETEAPGLSEIHQAVFAARGG